jgi:hypothetical protein
MDVENQIIKENNIMIARFMNGIIDSDGIIQKTPDEAGFDCKGYNAFGFLLYDVSWDWIIPVVEKIEMLEPDIEFTITGEIVYYNNQEFIGKGKLNAIYKAVIAAIHLFSSKLN